MIEERTLPEESLHSCRLIAVPSPTISNLELGEEVPIPNLPLPVSKKNLEFSGVLPPIPTLSVVDVRYVYVPLSVQREELPQPEARVHTAEPFQYKDPPTL